MTPGIPYRLSARGIHKSFVGVRALTDVDFNVRPGEIHGLLGANGAGKSTLIGVISGALSPDLGTLEVDGQTVRAGSLRAARKAGINVVHQELMLFPDRSVEENIAAASMPRGTLGILQLGARRRQVQRVLDGLGVAMDLSRRVGELPLAQRQLVEIGRALSSGGGTLILDEPTSALARPEAEGLFRTLRLLAQDGAAVVFVSHRLDEVFELTDRVTVLRDGAVVGGWKTSETDVGAITRAMVGELATERPSIPPVRGKTLLQISQGQGHGVGPIDFDLHEGEIVGLAGLEGSGTSNLLEMMGGVRTMRGQLVFAGTTRRYAHPGQAIDDGIVYLPPDRKKDGLWLERSPIWNVTAGIIRSWPAAAMLTRRRLAATASAGLDSVGVRETGRHLPARQLSGGNQQRVLLARALQLKPKVLLLSDFTRGVDVRAKAAIHELVRELARHGIAICLTSSDLDELLEISHRLVFLRGGRKIAEGDASQYNPFSLFSLVTTGTAAETAHA